MQEKIFTGADLEKALASGTLAKSGIELVGMVKASEKENHVSFTKSGCDAWVDLPTGMIEQATHFGMKNCKEHSHPIMKIILKEAKNPEAQILSALLSQPIPVPSQYNSNPMQAGQDDFTRGNTLILASAVRYCRSSQPGWLIDNTLCGECADFVLKRVCIGLNRCWYEWVQTSNWQWECWEDLEVER